MDNLLKSARHHLSTLPGWVTAPAIGLAVLLVLVFLVRFLRGSKNEDGQRNGLLSFLDQMGPQGKVALAGVTVSVYGLWGFAADTAHLPWPIRIGFIVMFDITELTIFGMLYKKADPDVGWTRNLKTMHYTAWGLVCFSSWANIVHAPNAAAAPFMAAMPVAAAWVVELELRERMGGKDAVVESSTGPLRMVRALWEKRWADWYADLGVDPNGSSQDLVKASAAKKAATELFKLRVMLEATAKWAKDNREQTRAQRRTAEKALVELEAQRAATQKAVDRADFGRDSRQALAVMRGLAGWTRTDDLAMVDTSEATEVRELIESVAIMPAAHKIESGEHAAAAEAARQDAERARQEAETARQDAKKAKAAAAEAEKKAEQKAAELRELGVATNRARQEAADARKDADRARQDAEAEMTELSGELDTLRQQVAEAADLVAEAKAKREALESAGLDAAGQKEELDGQIKAASEHLAKLEGSVRSLTEQREEALSKATAAYDKAEQLEAELKTLQERAEAEREAVELQAAAAAEASQKTAAAEQKAGAAAAQATALELAVREAELVLDDLRGAVREELPEELLAGQLPADGVFFRGSEAKQAAWEEYLQAVTSNEPTLDYKALAKRYSISESNARNWRLDFRRVRQLMIAKAAPSAAEHDGAGAEQDAETAEHGPYGPHGAASMASYLGVQRTGS
ncbi:hypothetical protein ACFV1W_30195 [Kitasatospora sp. NPDC059648]|uniref:hypothetical protein n=1 Tax=Kitasatospora sp. NPDC059648 TaxID=3346894 RepID=UPI003689AE68